MLRRLVVPLMLISTCCAFITPDIRPPRVTDVDTTLVLRGVHGELLHYPVYSKLLLTGEYYADIRSARWYLRRYPDSVLAVVNTFRDRLDSASRMRNMIYRLSRADEVLVLKAQRKLYIRRNGKSLFVFPVNLGRNPLGAKQREGDGRTPEGIYRLELKSWRAQYYRNFHISYPNAADSLKAQQLRVSPGGDVMIHGTGASRAGRKDWTNGCIALSNAQMDTLFKYVPTGTQIEIRK